ncbi:isoprenylcysteine carboxylmethyltransferase family protein [Alsobacter soli]|uniref:Isoprenylcysteine carboxylmethyltransferase family protein n=1 Tax=Alsobacter soli TaxID=2109933 RepID=A0A2T1HMV2_9HYPH|nr:isoprenylcysteine carboxylmethyltransferase family protein [Alsobacter soli]PSC02995.1 isoprenylcysteine carboxylmethyltransferase family protein [Alsobacter soli]
MAKDIGERPNTIPWPPLIYSAALLVAWGLEQVDPFLWLDRQLRLVPEWAGLGLFGLGVLMDFACFIVLRRHGTTVLPNAPSRNLVTTGPYRWSRNPIYVANTVALIGFALALRWGWLLFLAPVTVAAVNWLAISREEAHLERRFGQAWRDYAAKVRRWL